MILDKRKCGGFTLIELLVVVAIIGVLASVVLASLNTARAKGRDARRLTDVKQIQTALELYFDVNGHYPEREAARTSLASCGGNADWCSLVIDIAPYLSLVGDPLGHQDVFVYYYDSDSGDSYQTYGLMIMLESSSNSSKETGDGGFYSAAYEVGQQPAFCMGKYLAGDRDWFYGGVNVCLIGN